MYCDFGYAVDLDNMNQLTENSPNIMPVCTTPFNWNSTFCGYPPLVPIF